MVGGDCLDFRKYLAHMMAGIRESKKKIALTVLPVLVSAVSAAASSNLTSDFDNATTGVSKVATVSGTVFDVWTSTAVLLLIIGLAVFGRVMGLVKGVVGGGGRRR